MRITARDDTFKGPGKVGLWTKADSVTYFDDLEVSTPWRGANSSSKFSGVSPEKEARQ